MEIGINIRKSPTVRTKWEKAKNPCRDQIWKTRTPSLLMQHLHRHRVRSTSWLPFCGTFSTMTEGLTWPFSRNWKIQQTIRSRSSRQLTWPTLRAIWHRPPAICHIELKKWRRSPTLAIESDYSELKVFWATRIIQLQVLPCILILRSPLHSASGSRLELHNQSRSWQKTASRQRGVCVEHLNKWKTSNSFAMVWNSNPCFWFWTWLQQGGNLMFAADCPTKRAAFMTDMTLGRWSHVPAFSILSSMATG